MEVRYHDPETRHWSYPLAALPLVVRAPVEPAGMEGGVWAL